MIVTSGDPSRYPWSCLQDERRTRSSRGKAARHCKARSVLMYQRRTLRDLVLRATHRARLGEKAEAKVRW